MYSIPMAYVQGVQARLVHGGHLKYANEQEALGDAQQLGQGLDENMEVDRGGLATEGATPDETQVVAAALADMASQASEEAQAASAKADIVQEAVAKLASLRRNEHTKFAEAASPGDNLVVAGHKPGQVAAGESSAKTTDKNKELSNAVPATVERDTHWNSSPGKQVDENKGTSGAERPHEGRNAHGGPVENLPELSNATPITRERANDHGGPGEQKDMGKGTSGVEKSAALSSILARL